MSSARIVQPRYIVDADGNIYDVSNPLPTSGVVDGAPVSDANPYPITIQDPTDATRQARLDASTHSIQTIDYAHHEIHSGSTFSIHLKNLLFAKAGEMGILFKTPDTAKWFHLIYSVDVATKSTFDILEAPTVDTGNYPAQFYEPINRNRNSLTESTVLSVRAAPAANEVGLILDGDTTPISADGTVIHTEVVGGAKNKPSSGGHTHEDEYILKQDTVYYFRVKGDDTGTADLQLSMEIIYYEHTDKS